jgi:hypothetical protein
MSMRTKTRPRFGVRIPSVKAFDGKVVAEFAGQPNRERAIRPRLAPSLVDLTMEKATSLSRWVEGKAPRAFRQVVEMAGHLRRCFGWRRASGSWD